MPNYRWLCGACRSPDATLTEVQGCVALQPGRFAVIPGAAYEASDRYRWEPLGERVIDEESLHGPRYLCSCGVMLNKPTLLVEQDGKWVTEIAGERYKEPVVLLQRVWG